MRISFAQIKLRLSVLIGRVRQGDGSGSLSRRYTNDWILLLSIFVLLVCGGALFGLLQFWGVQDSAKPKDTNETPNPTITLDTGALQSSLKILEEKKTYFRSVSSKQVQIVDPSQ